MIFLVFAFALGRRLIDALGTVENLNVILEERVAVASAELERNQSRSANSKSPWRWNRSASDHARDA
jgi:hypothetical protein